jgi:glycosyltransferase involved in cell wall biosynthesis
MTKPTNGGLSMLEAPLPLHQQHWPAGTTPLVGVCCITYNHAKFIAEALDGFLMQETTFPVEIIVHDDASTDGNQEIISEYAKRFPSLIRPILQKTNQYSRTGDFLGRVLQEPRGKYVAICDGDDYWTDPQKLQLQFDLLESDPEAAGCFHLMELIDEDGEKLGVYPPQHLHRDRVFEDVAIGYYLSTCSIMYRKHLYQGRPEWARGLYMEDGPLIAELCQKGTFRCIHRNMGVYRQHGKGFWTSLDYRRKPQISFDLMDAVLTHFRDRDLPRVRETRKRQALEIFKLAAAAGKKTEARKYLWKYLVSRPKPWRLPPNQKRTVLKCLFP